MRLIDADETRKRILEEAVQKVRENRPEIACGLKMAADLVNNTQTAYDVDKVVEQLNEISYWSFHEEIEDYVELGDAIEIVKEGGVDEQD